MDFITKHQGVLDFGNSTIKLNEKLYDLMPLPTRSTLVRSQHAQIIDTYSSQDIPVRLTRPVETACMLIEPISSLTPVAEGLEVPRAIVSSQSTACRLTDDTDIPAGCAVAIARNVCINDITEMIDFLHDECDTASQVNVVDQAHDENDDADDFDKHMPFPEQSDVG